MTTLLHELAAVAKIITAPVLIPAIAVGLLIAERLRPDPETWRQWSYP